MGIKKGEQFGINNSEDVKRLLAKNLTTLGQASVSAEPILSLINKVASIQTGFKMVRGTTKSGTSVYFPVAVGSSAAPNGVYDVTVTTLDFKPTLIFAYCFDNKAFNVYHYGQDLYGGINQVDWYKDTTSTNKYCLDDQKGRYYVNDTGFKIGFNCSPGTNIYWIASNYVS